MRWLGAGWPDYTWLFGTDGEYTAFAAVAAGQFEPIKAHLRALRDVSVAINPDSGKIVHEVTPDGAVYFGADEDPGNTDESAKYPSAVALVWRWTGDEAFLRDLYPASKRAMEFVAGAGRGRGRLAGGSGQRRAAREWARRSWTTRSTRSAGTRIWPTWPRPRGDGETRRWAVGKAQALLQKFEGDWWYGGDTRLLRRLAGRSRQQEGLPAALDRVDPDRRGIAADPGPCSGPPGLR